MIDMNRTFTCIFNTLFVAFGIILAVNFILTDAIAYTGSISREFSNICIIVCSIALTAIIAALRIVYKDVDNPPLDEPIHILSGIPVFGVLFGLLSFYFSYCDIFFSRILAGASLVATISSVTIIYSVFILRRDRLYHS